MGIYPSISVEYPSVREYIRQFLSNIRLYENISVCTGIYPPVREYIRLYENISVSSRIYPPVREYIRLYENISVCTGIYPSIFVEYPSVREYIQYILLYENISACTGIYPPCLRIYHAGAKKYPP